MAANNRPSLNRYEFQEISRLRLREAFALLKAGHYPGAYYLAGYAVECALKACIAKQTKRYDFPNRNITNKAWVHNLEELITLAELWTDMQKDIKANKNIEINWTTVKDWKESSRYEINISDALARDFYSACAARKDGIIPWIKKRW